GFLIGTPASISASEEPHTEAIDDEPLDSRMSETTRIVYGNSSVEGTIGTRARSASAPWPMSRRFGPRMKPASPTENGGEMWGGQLNFFVSRPRGARGSSPLRVPRAATEGGCLRRRGQRGQPAQRRAAATHAAVAR